MATNRVIRPAYTIWLDRFVNEKGLDLDFIFEVEGESGPNYIPLDVLLNEIKSAGHDERMTIKKMIVNIDFRNGSVMDYFHHLCQALAI